MFYRAERLTKKNMKKCTAGLPQVYVHKSYYPSVTGLSRYVSNTSIYEHQRLIVPQKSVQRHTKSILMLDGLEFMQLWYNVLIHCPVTSFFVCQRPRWYSSRDLSNYWPMSRHAMFGLLTHSQKDPPQRRPTLASDKRWEYPSWLLRRLCQQTLRQATRLEFYLEKTRSNSRTAR